MESDAGVPPECLWLSPGSDGQRLLDPKVLDRPAVEAMEFSRRGSRT
jgi:hypothetical protein